MVEEKEQPHGLDEVMLAMDVVDTLRHRQSLVERELNSDQREQKLLERLREIYAAQGIEVPDQVLAQGVAALREDRFTYAPPQRGLAVALARVYVSRRRWGKIVGFAVGAVIAAWIAYGFLISGPAERRLQEQVAALEQLPQQLEAVRDAIQAISEDPEALDLAGQHYALGQSALKAGDHEQAKTAMARLEALRVQLQQAYTLRIVSRPGEPSGVWRIPDDNPGARNYYLIVEAISPEGKTMVQTIRSEEDGETEQVTQWGLRVESAVFNRVRADKQDDGIIQDRQVGVKRPGYLAPDYRIATTGGAITHW